MLFGVVRAEVAVVCAIGVGWSAVISRPAGSAVMTYLSIAFLTIISTMVMGLLSPMVTEERPVRVWGLTGAVMDEYNRALETLQHDIVQDLIDRVLIIKEFRKDEKKKIPPNFVDDEIAQTQNIQFEGDRSKFLAYLRSKGKTQREYRREVEEDIIYGYMRQQMRKSTSLISPVKIETYYNENKDKFYQDDAVEMRLIQINRNALTDDELRAAATNVITRLNACLLYTSDAADDLLCVDLGGRRIIKKKKSRPARQLRTPTTNPTHHLLRK